LGGRWRYVFNYANPGCIGQGVRREGKGKGSNGGKRRAGRGGNDKECVKNALGGAWKGGE